MSKASIAIVGRPNVGKSSLFNAIAGERISIVHDSPGVTRDRIYVDCDWYGYDFRLIDTGGLEIDSSDPLLHKMQRQVEFAMETADLVIFLCDIRDGITSQDRDIADFLRRSAKPVILALNKADTPQLMSEAVYEFYELGLGEPYPVSASHKLGLADLMSAALSQLPQEDFYEEDSDRISVAIIGKPNVGKSSLLNYLLGESRAIVSDVPGTTRDALSVDIDNEYGSYRIVDTAGLRRKAKVDTEIERYANLRTTNSIEKADVCLIMLDASEPLSNQDSKIAGLAHNAGKASIFLINKWDLMDDKQESFRKWTEELRNTLSFMLYAPMHTMSVLSTQRVDKIFEMINRVYEESRKRLPTAVVNEVLAEAVLMHRPPSYKGRSLKLYYASQVSSQPPHIVIFVNDPNLLHFSYERYLENRFREAFAFEGSPLRLTFRPRKQDDNLRVKNEDRK